MPEENQGKPLLDSMRAWDLMLVEMSRQCSRCGKICNIVWKTLGAFPTKLCNFCYTHTKQKNRFRTKTFENSLEEEKKAVELSYNLEGD